MLGVDVSNNQGVVNWGRLRQAGVRYGWAKATEGRTYTDSLYVKNRLGALSAGVLFGSYHFARPDHNSAPDEAHHFLNVVSPHYDPLRPVLDFETGGLPQPAMVAWATKWLTIVGLETGVRPVLYTYPDFWITECGNSLRLADYPLWLASYGVNDGKRHSVRPVGGWRTVHCHQYTSNGRLRGFGGAFDLNHADDLGPLLRKPSVPVKPKRPSLGLPGPVRKPAWFWPALKEFLARRKRAN